MTFSYFVDENWQSINLSYKKRTGTNIEEPQISIIKKNWALIIRYFQEIMSPRLPIKEIAKGLTSIFTVLYCWENIYELCSSKYFGGIVPDVLKVADEIEKSYLSGFAKWMYPDGCASIIISKLPNYTSTKHNQMDIEQDPASLRMNNFPEFLYFIVESPIPIAPYNGYIRNRKNPSIEFGPGNQRCTIRIFAINSRNPTYLFNYQNQINAELKNTLGEIFDFKSNLLDVTFKQLEEDWKRRDIEPFKKISKDLLEGKSDDFSRDMKVKVTPQIELDDNSTHQQFLDCFFHETQFQPPVALSPESLNKVLERIIPFPEADIETQFIEL